jgi:hypothetical protein
MLRAMQRGTRGKENEGSKEKQSCKIRQGKREVKKKKGKEDNEVLGRWTLSDRQKQVFAAAAFFGFFFFAAVRHCEQKSSTRGKETQSYAGRVSRPICWGV